jgi:hypothetical protein
MSEVKKKIIINHEHLNPNAQKRAKNGSNTDSRRTLKKMPGFVRPSELKNNLIKLLKQKREEKIQQQQQQQQPRDVLSSPMPTFDKKKYENIFSKDFEESLNYLKSFKQQNHHHSMTPKRQHQNHGLSVPAMLDVPNDFTSPMSLEMPSFIP